MELERAILMTKLEVEKMPAPAWRTAEAPSSAASA